MHCFLVRKYHIDLELHTDQAPLSTAMRNRLNQLGSTMKWIHISLHFTFIPENFLAKVGQKRNADAFHCISMKLQNILDQLEPILNADQFYQFYGTRVQKCLMCWLLVSISFIFKITPCFVEWYLRALKL